MAAAKVVLTFVVLLLLVGIGGMICGAYGSFWYTSSYAFDVHTGLWKECTNIKQQDVNCTERKDIFKFSPDKEFMFKVNTQTYDIVLVSLIGAGGFGCIALLFTTIMCCVRSPSGWRAVSSCVGILALLAVGTSAFAVAYADLFIRREMPDSEKNLYVHGWSSILAWVGGAGFILAFIMSIVLCFVLPRKPYSQQYGYDDTHEEFRYKASPNSTQNTMRNTANRQQFSSSENAGYEMT